jgi:AcrR family transcriptional regulator
MPRTTQANQEIREETSRRILEAARHVFAIKGSGATMADVAAQAGVSQGLAYRYFPSKEAMLTKLVDEAANASGGPAARLKEIHGTPGERLDLLISYLLKHRREEPEFYRFLYQVMADEAVAPELRRIVSRNGEVIQGEIRRLILEGQATREIADDDPDQLMVALMALIDGLVRLTPLAGARDHEVHFPETRIVLRLLKPDRERVQDG